MLPSLCLPKKQGRRHIMVGTSKSVVIHMHAWVQAVHWPMHREYEAYLQPPQTRHDMGQHLFIDM